MDSALPLKLLYFIILQQTSSFKCLNEDIFCSLSQEVLVHSVHLQKTQANTIADSEALPHPESQRVTHRDDDFKVTGTKQTTMIEDPPAQLS